MQEDTESSDLDEEEVSSKVSGRVTENKEVRDSGLFIIFLFLAYSWWKAVLMEKISNDLEN